MATFTSETAELPAAGEDVEGIRQTSGAFRQVVSIGGAGDNSDDVIGPLNETAPATDTAASGLNGRLQRIAQRLSTIISSGLALAAGENFVGAVGGVIANPASTLTRPANTTPYTANDLIANNTTAGSITVPSFTAARVAAGSFLMRRFRLYTNKTSGMAGIVLRVEFWSAAPTFTNGDNGAYAVATGAANWLGAADVVLTQVGDGAYGVGVPDIGGDIGVKLASGQTVYWSMLVTNSGGFTPASSQTFTLVPEIVQN
ncbi:MAG: hypothetical protein ACM31O_14070 [Bacteroidota bacterium]